MANEHKPVGQDHEHMLICTGSGGPCGIQFTLLCVAEGACGHCDCQEQQRVRDEVKLPWKRIITGCNPVIIFSFKIPASLCTFFRYTVVLVPVASIIGCDMNY